MTPFSGPDFVVLEVPKRHPPKGRPQNNLSFARISWKSQELRKGGFSKGSFCRVQCHGQGNQEYPRILAPAVDLALRAPQPREAYMLQTPLLKKTFFLVPENP